MHNSCLSGLHRYKPEVQLDELAETTDRVSDPGRAGAQLYEEIREPETQTVAQTVAPRVSTIIPQYEDVTPTGRVAKSGDYQITQCSAYGVTLNNWKDINLYCLFCSHLAGHYNFKWSSFQLSFQSWLQLTDILCGCMLGRKGAGAPLLPSHVQETYLSPIFLPNHQSSNLHPFLNGAPPNTGIWHETTKGIVFCVPWLTRKRGSCV